MPVPHVDPVTGAITFTKTPKEKQEEAVIVKVKELEKRVTELESQVSTLLNIISQFNK